MSLEWAPKQVLSDLATALATDLACGRSREAAWIYNDGLGTASKLPVTTNGNVLQSILHSYREPS